jgi:outer membrane protein TolC
LIINKLRVFLLTPALSLGERENRRQTHRNMNIPRIMRPQKLVALGLETCGTTGRMRDWPPFINEATCRLVQRRRRVAALQSFQVFGRLMFSGLVAALLVTGCRGLPAAGEKPARQDLAAVGGLLQSNLPVLSANATLPDCVLFAVRNHPLVAAAYEDWADSVEQITVERSLPDPKLTLELDAANALTSLMPGLMADLPGPGKLAARAAAASAESRVKYFQFESAVLQTAFAVGKSYYPLHYLDSRLEVNRQTLTLLAGLETLARAQNEVGRGTLQDVLRAQIEQEKLKTDTANLEDSRRWLLAQFKAALGLHAEQPDPPVPALPALLETRGSDEEGFARALKQNPRLKEMAAEIQAADAAIRIAGREKVPDFSAGGEVDVKASPFVWNPQLSMTLPVWRDKLAAELAAAQAAKRGAEARLSAEQLGLAVDFAEQTWLIREANRNLALLRERLLPRARESLAVARAAYRSGQLDFLNVIDAERSLLDFQLDEIAAQTQREVAREQLALLVAGVPPEQAPLLKTEREFRGQARRYVHAATPARPTGGRSADLEIGDTAGLETCGTTGQCEATSRRIPSLDL